MGHNVPKDLKYTNDHEWAHIDGDTATIGITDFAQASLGDIVFVELPESGTVLEKGNPFGVVESIKSVNDLYAPLSGTILESNSKIVDSPELCNSDAYNSWFIKLTISNEQETSSLMSADQYIEHCNNAN